MKIQFNKSLQFQLNAINAIVDIFEGQETYDTNLTVHTAENLEKKYLLESNNDVYSNDLKLGKKQLLKNIQDIQSNNGLHSSKANGFDFNNLDFTIEMETGTGKTYVYLRTIMEMYRKYGFSKHIIVVPSIPIKAGVFKSLQITEEHFRGIYGNIPYNFFVYDSGNHTDIMDFAHNKRLEIMVINIQAFRKSFENPSEPKKANIIHRYNDQLGDSPLDLIKKTNPFVFVDEPQTAMSTPSSQKAVKNLNPLAIFRYSATHREKINLMYKLDIGDACKQKLVKQIEVGSIQAEGDHSKCYIKLLEVMLSKVQPKAKIQVDALVKGKIKRKSITVHQNDDLEQITNRTAYQGYIIKDIYGKEGEEFIDFTSNNQYIKLGQSIGDIDELELKTDLISKTIEEHLKKEKVLNPKGIKVLSLFFIDKVVNYRQYDKEGNPVNGQYADIFEKEYTKLIGKYEKLFSSLHPHGVDVSSVHNGYFSIDKGSKKSNSKERIKDTEGNTKADENTYNLIMRDKEKLLGFDSKLRFIFSHSALKEGWDNPNVFQICTLRDSGKSDITPRQQIGRGLRLCVNQNGERVYGHEVNTLTVMVTKSYHDFVDDLVDDIKKKTKINFRIIEADSFVDELGKDKSKELYDYLIREEYIDKEGKVQVKLRLKLDEKTFQIPEDIESHKKRIKRILSKLKSTKDKLYIKNRDDKKRLMINDEVFGRNDFKCLWDRVKHKTTFSVNFKSSPLIEMCVESIKKLKIKRVQVEFIKTALKNTGGQYEVNEESAKIQNINLDSTIDTLPEIVDQIEKETKLTRKTIVAIFNEVFKNNGSSDKKANTQFEYFKVNPESFIKECINIINIEKRLHIVKGIQYDKIGENKFYCHTRFINNELYGYLKINLVGSSKSPYNYVIYDSDTEKKFAKGLEKRDEICVYAKLPMWFKIDTPLGTYNPDWVVKLIEGDKERIYFVVETKASDEASKLRPIEYAKFQCGEKHFERLGTELLLATDVADFLSKT
ncbi:MAG: DEAD/DEAH box helicase family protein [Flavobacteriaceae bacterium]|nr:DEAD/DEAH box helicase family protein [Flavobacteriaceae bacterium]